MAAGGWPMGDMAYQDTCHRIRRQWQAICHRQKAKMIRDTGDIEAWLAGEKGCPEVVRSFWSERDIATIHTGPDADLAAREGENG